MTSNTIRWLEAAKKFQQENQQELAPYQVEQIEQQLAHAAIDEFISSDYGYAARVLLAASRYEVAIVQNADELVYFGADGFVRVVSAHVDRIDVGTAVREWVKCGGVAKALLPFIKNKVDQIANKQLVKNEE